MTSIVHAMLCLFHSLYLLTVESFTCAVLQEPRCSFSRSVGWRNAVGGGRGVGCDRRGHDGEAGELIAEGAVLVLDRIAVTTAETADTAIAYCVCDTTAQ